MSTQRLLLVVGSWLVAVLALGAAGAFVTPPGVPPVAIVLAAALPLLAFAAAYRLSAGFRALVLSADLRLLAAMQAWRLGGFLFLALWANGVLPGLFSWPAALGDMAVGLAAPFIVLALVRDPAFAATRRFVAWNVFGIFDLAVALTMGGLGSGLLPELTGDVTTQPMARLPLALIPGFLVPLMVMVHIASLLQSGRLASRNAHGLAAGAAT